MSNSDDTGQEISSADQNEVAPLEYEDLSIKCIDCRKVFTWTAGEQIFFYQKNLTNPPKRCKPCKKAKNHRLSEIEKARSNGKRHRIVMPAECASCGKVTTVPFYPSQGRPVYCRSCYQQSKIERADASSA
jgi:CxxC-x17-CxxC domain-containing protein